MEEREKRTQEVESSIMEWFKGKGVVTGNPSDILEEQQEVKLRGILSKKESTGQKTSSLLNRRLKTKLTLG